MHILASKPESIRDIESILKVIDKEISLDEDTYNNVLISLTEAVNNAIHHGNCEDESKYVRIKVKKKEDLLKLTVEDEGEGFDFKNVPNPTLPENLNKCGGRGVFLITQLCDSVNYRNNGSSVEMCFKLK